MSQTFPLEENDRFQISTAAALQTEFQINFPFQLAADITVLRTVDDVTDLLTIGDDYTIVGENEPSGGTLTLTEECEGGEVITRLGDATIARLMNVTLGGKYSTRQIEADLDRLTIIAQEHRRDLARSYKTALGDEPGDLGEQLASVGQNADAAAASAAAAEAWSAAAETKADEAAGSASSAAAEAAAAASSAATSLADRIAAVAAKVAAEAAALAADTDANDASGDASSAAADASLAIAARIAAEGARDAALAAFDDFDDKYLGAKATDPALDNDGNGLVDGAIYWNTTSKNWRAYDLATTTWFALVAGSSASGVASTPAGNLAATNVQDALNELDDEKFELGDVDTDGALTANSDAKVASQKATRTFVNSAISGVLGGVSAAFDTLAEIAAALGVISADAWVTTARIADTAVTFAKLATAAVASASEFRSAAASKLLAAGPVWTAAEEVTLTDAATITVDGATFINATVTLAGSRTLGTWANAKAGQSGYIRFVQDGTGSRTLAYHADYEFAGGTAPTLSTPAGAQDMLFYQVIAPGRVLLNIVKAIA